MAGQVLHIEVVSGGQSERVTLKGQITRKALRGAWDQLSPPLRAQLALYGFTGRAFGSMAYFQYEKHGRGWGYTLQLAVGGWRKELARAA